MERPQQEQSGIIRRVGEFIEELVENAVEGLTAHAMETQREDAERDFEHWMKVIETVNQEKENQK